MKVILILSGGMDSTTLLYDLLHQKHEVKAISFNYGQRHERELTAAEATCEFLKVDHKVIDLNEVNELLQGSSLTSGDIKTPTGHYRDESMKLTVVPNRNMILLSLAIGYAISLGYDTVAYGAHAGDHAIYPDCRPIFIEKIRELAKIVDYKPINILTPFENVSKIEILKTGSKLGVDYSKTWTCYDPQDDNTACGKCGSCTERLEAFDLNNLKDPIPYHDYTAKPQAEGDCSAKKTIPVACTACGGKIYTYDPIEGEILECNDCQASFEITSLEPFAMVTAPGEEEDWGE